MRDTLKTRPCLCFHARPLGTGNRQREPSIVLGEVAFAISMYSVPVPDAFCQNVHSHVFPSQLYGNLAGDEC